MVRELQAVPSEGGESSEREDSGWDQCPQLGEGRHEGERGALGQEWDQWDMLQESWAP